MLTDIDAERALLGAVLSEPDQLPKLLPLIGPVDFGEAKHAMIWAALQELSRAGTAIDILVLSSALQRAGQLETVGGSSFLVAIANDCNFAAHAENYAKIIRDKSHRRRAIQAAKDFARALADPKQEVEDVMARYSGELARQSSIGSNIRTLREVHAEVFERLNAIQDGSEPILETGIEDWDKVLGGFQPTLTVIGGRTGGGKSALTATFLRTLAQNGTTVGLFSLEDTADWLGYRYIADVSGLPNFVVRYRKKRDAEWASIAATAGKLNAWDQRIVVDDTPNLTTAQIVSRATDMVINRGARAIFVDHLQEVEHSTEADRHELKMRRSLQDLRALANRLRVPVILLAQAKEDNGTRKAGEPPSVFDFADAPNAIAKISRVAVIVTTDPEAGEMDCWVVKHTNGHNRISIKLRFFKTAGLVGPMKAPEPRVPDLFAFQADDDELPQ
jgi:replicative DNA helicase